MPPFQTSASPSSNPSCRVDTTTNIYYQIRNMRTSPVVCAYDAKPARLRCPDEPRPGQKSPGWVGQVTRRAGPSGRPRFALSRKAAVCGRLSQDQLRPYYSNEILSNSKSERAASSMSLNAWVILIRLSPAYAPATSERGGSSACCGKSSVISNQGALLATKKWRSGRIPGSSSRPPRAIPSSGVRSGRFTIGEPQTLQNPR